MRCPNRTNGALSRKIPNKSYFKKIYHICTGLRTTVHSRGGWVVTTECEPDSKDGELRRVTSEPSASILPTLIFEKFFFHNSEGCHFWYRFEQVSSLRKPFCWAPRPSGPHWKVSCDVILEICLVRGKPVNGNPLIWCQWFVQVFTRWSDHGSRCLLFTGTSVYPASNHSKYRAETMVSPIV